MLKLQTCSEQHQEQLTGSEGAYSCPAGCSLSWYGCGIGAHLRCFGHGTSVSSICHHSSGTDSPPSQTLLCAGKGTQIGRLNCFFSAELFPPEPCRRCRDGLSLSRSLLCRQLLHAYLVPQQIDTFLSGLLC